MDWLVPEIFSFILGIGKDAFIGWRGRIKLKNIKKGLRKEFSEKILKRYGNEIFYNDLDSFLSQNNIILKVIEHCTNTSVSQYRSNSAIVTFYIKQFEERYPKYTIYHLEIINMLQQCFDIIFNALNQIEDEKIRAVCNVVKEVAGELSFQIQELISEIKVISKKMDLIISAEQPEQNEFSYRSYFEFIARSYPQYSISKYIQRKIYQKEADGQKADAISILLQKKRVLLLGEAGYGKTYEAISLLKSICVDEDTEKIIPFYLPLSEYGLLFGNIKDGIRNKVTPFVKGNADELIEEWLKSGNVVLILDGIDDIVKEEDRTKFILDVKNISQQYSECYYFVTSRINRYHQELDEFNQHYLVGLDRHTIQNKLWEEGITVHVPEDYYQLFANPLFLEAGKTVLKKSPHREMFNRSVLFEELIKLLYAEWNQRKGIKISQPLSFVEVVSVLGKFAFESFNKPAYGFFEFEQNILSLLPSHNRSGIIGSVLSSGIIRVTDGVAFTHKLFKEFCVAYYLFLQYPLSKNKALYLSLINRDEWKEVFIFLVGMHNCLELQDEFLDFLMENNLKLYVECINAKSDLYRSKQNIEHRVLAQRYLEQIYKTYIFIVSTYFKSIAFDFEPRINKNHNPDLELIIVGSLSADAKHLSYWLDYSLSPEKNVFIIDESELGIYREEKNKNAKVFGYKSFGTYYINLSLSGLEGDSGRKIAIDLIKKQLDNILDKKLLEESEYLLCERVNDSRSKLKELKDVFDFCEMKKWVEQQIESVKPKHPDAEIRGYNHSGVELFDLWSWLKCLIDRKSVFNECVLPGRDVVPGEKDIHYIWDLYSTKQLENRIGKFFEFHQLSYRDMIDRNFPTLANMFSQYLDSPYKNIIIFDKEEEAKEDGFFSQPGFTYYHIAVQEGDSIKSEIREATGEIQEEGIFEQMTMSYQRLGKQMHRGKIGSTIIQPYLDNQVLQKYVYRSIKESLEEVFGSFR